MFSNGQEQKDSSDAALIARLYQEIGQAEGGAYILLDRGIGAGPIEPGPAVK